jgi:hypothetical protein
MLSAVQGDAVVVSPLLHVTDKTHKIKVHNKPFIHNRFECTGERILPILMD